MKLIADSGSSKTQWYLVKNKEIIKKIETKGLNPFFSSSEFINQELSQSALSQFKNQISEILFYGAGCSSVDRNEFLQSVFSSYFPLARKITIEHDMLGACIALFGSNDGIACILGTGSNSCVYRGGQISENIPALGYILGDEAGGAYFGKIILRDYLYHTLPPILQNHLSKTMQLDKEEIFSSVYKKELPNRYLASFSSILSQFRDLDYTQTLLLNGFEEFVKYHILCYKEAKTLPIGAVGSIAYVFEKEFSFALEKNGLKLQKVFKSPLDGMVLHLS